MNAQFNLRRSLTVLTLALCAAWFSSAGAAEQEGGAVKVLKEIAAAGGDDARKDSLELPGVTACHTCEWRPLKTEMETDQCANKIGWFDCGRDESCDKKCVFVKCSE